MFELSESDIPADSTLETASAVEGQSVEAIPSSNDPLATTTQPNVYEYQANGKTISEDLDTILKRASQGYNYAQSIAEHKNSVSQFQAERDQHLQQYGTWKQYDEYATTNPDWANFVKEQWEQRSTAGQSIDSTQQGQDINPEVRAFMNEYKENQRIQEEQAQDAALNEQIQSVQKQFPEFDLSWSEPSTGKSNEMLVIEHAKAHGINSFQAAFKDLMFDQIVSKRITSAKEAAAKELADRTKQGFISKTDTSLQGLGMPNVKSGGSMHDALLRSASELGIDL